MSNLSKLNPKFEPAFDGIKIAKDAVERLHTIIPILEAYLFGSSANHKNTVDSDLDILVIIENDANIKDYFVASQKPGLSSIATDWIFKYKSEFEDELQTGGISRVATQEGVKVFPNG